MSRSPESRPEQESRQPAQELNLPEGSLGFARRFRAMNPDGFYVTYEIHLVENAPSNCRYALFLGAAPSERTLFTDAEGNTVEVSFRSENKYLAALRIEQLLEQKGWTSFEYPIVD